MTYNLTTLPNGLRVATRHMPGVETVSLGVFVDIGARYEDESNNGISHFLEHMAFKGTETRSAHDIAREFDAIGGHLNAYTSMEHTVYYAKVLQEDFGKAVNILTDILLNSIFDETELVREREVILQEIAMHKDSPDDLVFDLFHQAVFPGQPMGRSILGSEANVSGFTRENLIHYMKTGYSPCNMVFAAAGKVDHDAVAAAVEQAMGAMETRLAPRPQVASYTGGEIRQAQKLEQLHLVMGFPGVSYSDPMYYSFQIFSAVMGGGMSSRLFQEVREKRGLAYSIGTYANAYPECGVFTIYSSTTEQHATELMQVVGEELAKASHTMTEQEIARAKSQIRSGIRMAMEGTTNQFEALGRNLLCFGRQRDPEEIIHHIERVTLEDIALLHDHIHTPEKFSLAVLGPVQHLPEFDRLERFFRQ